MRGFLLKTGMLVLLCWAVSCGNSPADTSNKPSLAKSTSQSENSNPNPISMDNPVSVQQLILDQPGLAEFSLNPGLYPNLKTLFVQAAPDCNELKSISLVPTLEALYIDDIECSEIPEDLRVLGGLKVLSLVLPVNDKVWPEWLSIDFPLLTDLKVNGMSVEFLPEDLSGLVSLRSLDLGDSPIRDLPDGWGNHPSLEEVFVNVGTLSPERIAALNAAWPKARVVVK